MKTYNIANRKSKTALSAIKNAISTHEHYKNSYFWKSQGNAGSRRNNESKFKSSNPNFNLITKNGLVNVEFSYSESARNVYYSMTITLDGVKKNITYLKNLIN